MRGGSGGSTKVERKERMLDQQVMERCETREADDLLVACTSAGGKYSADLPAVR